MLFFRYIITCLFIFNVFLFAGDTIIEDPAQGYSVFLPQNWKKVTVSDSQDYFFDTTFTYKSRISIVSYNLDTLYDTPGTWTRFHFSVYKTYIDLVGFPYGAVLYWDSAQTVMQDSLWACELYARFFGLDTTMYAWDEYVRYSESGNRGYEIYALGDTVDMKTNISLYGAIIQAIAVDKSTATVRISNSRFSGKLVNPELNRISPMYRSADFLFDLSGRTRQISNNNTRVLDDFQSQGCYFNGGRRIIRY